MSAVAAIAKLHSPLRELVAGVADAHHGKSEKDKAEVTEWIENVAAGQAVKPDSLKACLSRSHDDRCQALTHVL